MEQIRGYEKQVEEFAFMKWGGGGHNEVGEERVMNSLV